MTSSLALLILRLSSVMVGMFAVCFWLHDALALKVPYRVNVASLRRFLQQSQARRGVGMQREEDPVTVFMGVPTMYSYLLSHYDSMPAEQQAAARAAASRLRLTVSGSAACPLPIMQRWRQLSGETPPLHLLPCACMLSCAHCPRMRLPGCGGAMYCFGSVIEAA